MPRKLSKYVTAACVFATALTVASAAASGLSDAEWMKLRAEALNRPRRVIVNNDGCDATEFPKELSPTKENIYRQMFDKLRSVQVDTVSYVPFGVGHVLATNSKVTQIHTGKSALKTSRNLTPELLKQGTDAMALAVEYCRAYGYEIFAGMRVNDMHDQWHPWLYPLKSEHPEWIFGSPENKPPYGAWTGFDFALPVTRDRFRAIVRELLTNYDVDGIELDFYRFPVLFKSVAWGESATPEQVEMITQMMRDIRNDSIEIGKRKGRYLLISARLPDSPELGREIGMDFETWMKEQLFDIYIPGGDFGRFSTYADSATLAHKYGLKCYPSVDTSWVRASGRFSRNDVGAYHAQSAAAMSGGSDGVYYFNMFYAPAYLNQISREPAGLAKYSKRYFANYQNVYRFCRRQHDFDPLLPHRGYGLLATANGRPASAMMEIADDFSSPKIAGQSPRIILRAAAPESEKPILEAWANGHRLGKPEFENGEYAFPVDPAFLKVGENFFEFRIPDAMAIPAKTILAGDQIAETPWQRLFPAKREETEKIVDGSYRLVSGAGQCANLLYPLPDLTGKKVVVELELLVESSSSPEAVALRLATGEYTEIITFEPERICLKFAGESVPFRTGDGFHSYRIETEGGRLRLIADGRKLLEGKLVMKAHDPKGYMAGNRSAVPLMDNRSLVIGSISPEGAGAGRWKNIRLELAGVPVDDVALDVQLAPEAPAPLQRAAAMPQPETVKGDAAQGAEGFRDFKSSYRPEFIQFAKGELRLNNNDPERKFANFGYHGPLVETEKGILSLEWTAAPRDPQSHTEQSFQMVLQPKAADDMVYNGYFRFAPKYVETPLGIFETRKKGFFTCRALLNLADGNLLLIVDGRPVASGRLDRIKGTPRLFFGDGSGNITGRAVVKSVKLGLIDIDSASEQ